MKHKWIAAALFGIIALSGSADGAAVPETIAYQGTLRSDGGAAISGMRSIEFKIYDDPTTGAVLWSETQSVAVVNGRFNVILGAVNPVSAAVFGGPETYLSLKVESDAEMAPRQKFSSVAYALKAGDADTVNGLRANEIMASGGAGVPFFLDFPSCTASGGAEANVSCSTTCRLIGDVPDGTNAEFTSVSRFSASGQQVPGVASSYELRVYGSADCSGSLVGAVGGTFDWHSTLSATTNENPRNQGGWAVAGGRTLSARMYFAGRCGANPCSGSGRGYATGVLR